MLNRSSDILSTSFVKSSLCCLFLRKYTDSVSDTTPFTLCNVQLFVATRRFDISSAPDAELHLTQLVLLAFTIQKNRVENKLIQVGLSRDPRVYVVTAVTYRVYDLQSHNAPPSTPLSRVYTGVVQCTQSVTTCPHLKGAEKGGLVPWQQDWFPIK